MFEVYPLLLYNSILVIKGSGIVEFSDSSSVKKCLEVMQRYEVKGRKLVIKEDTGNIRDRHGAVLGGNAKRGRDSDRFRDDHRDMGGNNLSLRQDDGKWGNTYGLSIQFLESLNIDAPLGNKVFVANVSIFFLLLCTLRDFLFMSLPHVL